MGAIITIVVTVLALCCSVTCYTSSATAAGSGEYCLASTLCIPGILVWVAPLLVWLFLVRGKDGESSRAPEVPAIIPAAAPIETAPRPAADPNAALEGGLRLLSVGKQTEATACFLAAFRAGPADLRRRAVAELEKLGEVETL
jgi:hypothetical protein